MVRTIALDIGLFALLRELFYTVSQMEQEPLAAAPLAKFQTLRQGWQAISTEEIGILEALSRAQAAVDHADAGLDIFAGRVSHLVDDTTDGPTRKQLRASLFKGKPLSRFRRPILSSQLATMTFWEAALTKSGVPQLVALAAEAKVLVAAGVAAEEKKKTAEQNNRVFRDVGARKQFVDAVNAERKEAHGALAKLPFQNPALPTDFADRFFMSEAPRDHEETIDEVEEAIVALSAQLDARNKQLDALKKAAEEERRAEEERQAQEQAAEDLEAQAAALLKKAAEIRKSK